MNSFINIFKKNKSTLFYSSVWLSFFISININPEQIYKLSIIELFRIAAPFFFTSLLLIHLLQKNNYTYTINILTTAPFIFYIIILCIFLLTNKNSNSYLNIYWGIAMLLPYLYLLIFINQIDQLKNFLLCSLAFLLVIFLFFVSKILTTPITEGKLVNFYGIYATSSHYLDSLAYYPPRSSGLARMAFIISISTSIYLIFKKNNSYLYYFLITLTVICSSLGLLFQSRTMTFIYISLMFLLGLILFFKKLLPVKKIFFVLFLFPFVLSITYKLINSISDNEIKKNNTITIKDYAGKLLLDSSKNIILRDSGDNYSSNRFNNWKKTFIISKEKQFIVGYGFQADRKLITDSVHNVYLYALISGGVIAMLLITFVSLRGAWTSFFILFNYTILKKKFSPIDLTSSFLILLFLQRGILENSYGIFSIDYLFFIICYFINEANYKKSLSI